MNDMLDPWQAEKEAIDLDRAIQRQEVIDDYIDKGDFYDAVSWCDSQEELAAILHTAHTKEMQEAIDDIIDAKDRILRQAAMGHAEKVCG